MLFGRDAVLEQAWEPLVQGDPVLLAGPPGIGKTALWRELVARAGRAGWLVLTCAPAESESALALAALADLLRPLAAHAAGLPGPQRAAVQAVLLTGDGEAGAAGDGGGRRDSGSAGELGAAGGAGVAGGVGPGPGGGAGVQGLAGSAGGVVAEGGVRRDAGLAEGGDGDGGVGERAVAAATRSLLDAAVASGRRVLVAVDDAPWLDPASARALTFALRRVPGLAVLAGARDEAGAGTPLGLDRLAGRLRRIDVAPLGTGALHHMLRDRLGVTLNRPLLARIARDCGGNPLLAMELTRAVLRLPRLPSPGEDLPFPATTTRLVAGTVAALPPAGRAAIRLAALLSVAHLRDLSAAGVDPAAFDPAEDAGLLTVSGGAVHFAHPLYAAAVRADIPASLRRRLHRKLAEVVADPDERARQLARCVSLPDAEVAAELAASAHRQRRRGAPQLAAALYEQAAHLTPPTTPATLARRRLAAARCHYDSGDYPAAAATATEVAEACGPTPRVPGARAAGGDRPHAGAVAYPGGQMGAEAGVAEAGGVPYVGGQVDAGWAGVEVGAEDAPVAGTLEAGGARHPGGQGAAGRAGVEVGDAFVAGAPAAGVVASSGDQTVAEGGVGEASVAGIPATDGVTSPRGQAGAGRAGAAVEVDAFAAGSLESAEVPHPGGGAAGAGDGVRAEALLLRAEVAWSADEPLAVAAQTAEQALRCAPAGSAQAGRIHAYLSLFHDTPELAQRHAEAACALLGGASPQDAELLSGSLLQLFFNEVRGGRPPRRELLDRALALEDGRPSWLGGTIPAIWWRSIDEHDKARARLHAMLERAVAAGDEPGQHELLAHLGETELVAGRYDDAARALAGARELGEQLGTGLVGETWLLGLLDAHRGALAAARAVAEAGLRRAEAVGDPWARRIHLALSAFTALSEGRTDDAAADYRALAAEADAAGLAEPLSQRFEPDWIEACAAAGDLATARRVLRRLAERHERLPRPWTTLGLARSRALLAAASGEDTAAPADALEEARARVPAHVVPLDRARCLLVAGVVRRRARRRRAARTALEQAAAEFAAIGAAAFERRARAELARTGGRAPASEALTATEERVAALAAAGRTNRAIADALFISPKTVEANLARVYRKLGISRRAELGAALARRPGT